MKVKKLMAVTLATTMVLGSSMTVMAAASTAVTAQNGVDVSTYSGGTTTGEGKSYPHVDTEIYKVTVPAVAEGGFDYKADPERLINQAGKLEDGTVVKANTDGIYFPQPTDAAGNAVYTSSQTVTVTGNNSAPLCVGVTAKAELSGDSVTTDIPMAATQAEFDTAAALGTTATMLMKLKVGETEKVIPGPTTSPGATGVTVNCVIPAQLNNFQMVPDTANNTFKYEAKTSGVKWQSVAIQLIGKVNQAKVTGTPTASKMKLTWTIAKPVVPTGTGTLTAGTEGTSSLTLTMGANATDITSVDVINNGVVTTLTRAKAGATEIGSAGYMFDKDATTKTLAIANKKMPAGATVVVNFDNLTKQSFTVSAG